MTSRTDKSTQVFPTPNYNTRLAELIGKMSESGEIAEEEVDPEITFKNANTASKPSIAINWYIVESSDTNEAVDEVGKEVEAFTVLFLARGPSELEIKRCGVWDSVSSADDLITWLRRLDTVARPLEVAVATAVGPRTRFLPKNAKASTDWPSLKAAIAAHFIIPCIHQAQRDALTFVSLCWQKPTMICQRIKHVAETCRINSLCICI